MSDFSDFAYPRARQEHKCHTCRRTIPAGEIYRRDTGKFEGEMFALKTCWQCTDFARELKANDITDWDHGGFVYLPDLDWQDVAELGSIRLLRALVLFRRRWTRPDGTTYPYPTNPNHETSGARGVTERSQ